MNISIENNKPEIRLNSQKLSENLAKRAEHDINSGKIAGCGLCVHQGGKEIFSGFFGYSDAEEKTPIQPNTIYPVSYTHLDVYKRQVPSRDILRSSSI